MDSPWEMLSAIGTLAAVVVALWVSGHAAYLTHRADKDRSELVAARMLSPLKELDGKASYIRASLASQPTDQVRDDTATLMAIKELSSLAQSISVEDLYPLLDLKSHAAKRAAMALGLIQSFSNHAIALLMHSSWSDVATRDIHIRRWIALLSEIVDHLAVAVAACQAAALTGAPRPTIEEIHGR